MKFTKSNNWFIIALFVAVLVGVFLAFIQVARADDYTPPTLGCFYSTKFQMCIDGAIACTDDATNLKLYGAAIASLCAKQNDLVVQLNKELIENFILKLRAKSDRIKLRRCQK